MKFFLLSQQKTTKTTSCVLFKKNRSIYFASRAAIVYAI